MSFNVCFNSIPTDRHEGIFGRNQIIAAMTWKMSVESRTWIFWYQFIYLSFMSDREYINSFSDFLFWDVEKDSIDLESNAPFVVSRVLELGRFNDWRLLVGKYGIPRIAEIAQNLRTLDPKALSFICALTSIPKESFRCYTTKPSTQTHWNF